MRWGFALSRSRSRADGARWWWREGVRGFASVGVGVSPSARARLGWKDGDGRGTASPPLISSGDSATLRAPLAALDLHACLPGRDARLASRSPRLPSVRTHRIGLIAGQWPCIAARLVVFVAAGRHGQVRSRVVYRVRSTSFGFQTFFFCCGRTTGRHGEIRSGVVYVSDQRLRFSKLVPIVRPCTKETYQDI